ncbi:MAG: hypothetical protein ACP5OA_00685 [Candidatus Woesearchaeota archaeon]
MNPYTPKKRNFTIPLYDIGALVAGFYIGYNEGKGIDVSQTVEYLTKYGPTAAAMLMTPIMLKTINAFGRWMNKKTIQNLYHENFEVTINNKIRKYEDLEEHQKRELKSKIMKNMMNLESRLQSQRYLRPTIIAGTRTAIETMIGYVAGSVYSQISQ